MLKKIISSTNSDRKSFNRYSQRGKDESPSQFEEEGEWELESLKNFQHNLENKYPLSIEDNNEILEQPYCQQDKIYQDQSDINDSSMQRADLSLSQSVVTAQPR